MSGSPVSMVTARHELGTLEAVIAWASRVSAHSSASTGVSSCTAAAANAGNSYTSTTCTPNNTTNVPVATCTAAAASAGNSWTTLANMPQGRVYAANYGSSSISVLRDSAGGIQEGVATRLAGSKPMPTVVRGVLFLSEVPSRKPQAASLLDISGRKVMNLRPGANDVRALAPGVYFVREEPQAASSKPQAVRKVVVTR